MRAVATRLALPLVVGGFTALVWLLIERGGLDRLAAYGIATIACFAVILVLERLLPYRDDWNAPDGQLLHDLGHTVVGTALGARLGHALNDVAFGALAVLIADRVGSPWPSSWPFALQLLTVFLVADLGRYVQHRLHHKMPLLWRFHALHHDVDKLSTVKNARSHAVERVLQSIFMFGPLLAIGAPGEVVFWYMASNSFLGQLDHSNVDARIGYFELLINGPASHRIHHGRAVEEGRSNFGSALVLWDMVFGTWRSPLTHPEVVATGVDEPEPRGFFDQLVGPFIPRARAAALPGSPALDALPVEAAPGSSPPRSRAEPP
jgi:ornithine lipid hydroxylase